MKEFITYSLNNSQINSDQYYSDINSFAHQVILEGKKDTATAILEFKNFIVQCKIENLRSEEEYMLELLTFGVLWKIYSPAAVKLSSFNAVVIRKLFELRRRNGTVKQVSDFIRGIMSTVFLAPDLNNIHNIEMSMKNINKFVEWLSAAGEFDEEISRFSNWVLFFKSLSVKQLNEVSVSIGTFANWFEAQSEAVLSKYTINVEPFLQDAYKKHRYKEDVIFCGRQKLEYHLNMAGAEILNRAFREDFLKTKVKKVLLPTCMRYNQNGSCKAELISDRYICRNCSAECIVNKITAMGRKYGFEVFIIPHSSSAFSNEKAKPGQVGIVGIACPLNLLSGGWRAKSLGLVPQCVILDYCGCKTHWNKSGIVTEINLNQLKKILNI